MKTFRVSIKTVSKVYSVMTYDLQAESEEDLCGQIEALHKDGRFVACDNSAVCTDDYEDEILAEEIEDITVEMDKEYYKAVYSDIQEVKKLIEGLSFDEAARKLCGFNNDGTLFDYDFGDFTGTVWNENGKAVIHKDCGYALFTNKSDYSMEEGLTEKDILERSK